MTVNMKGRSRIEQTEDCDGLVARTDGLKREGGREGTVAKVRPCIRGRWLVVIYA